MPNAFKAISEQRNRIKILGRINLLTFFLLIYLLKSNYFFIYQANKKDQKNLEDFRPFGG